jgi:hypothetical protein
MTHEEYDALEEIVGGSYNRGYADGLKTGRDGGYRSGLEDAWECARKIILSCGEGGYDAGTIEDIFGMSYHDVLKECKPNKAIELIKEYEEQQKQKCESCFTEKLAKEKWASAKDCKECKHFTDTDEVHGYTPCGSCNADLHNFESKQTDATDSDDECIKVGDEVYLFDIDRPKVVTNVNNTFAVICDFCDSGQSGTADVKDLHKTGRHFSQIAEVLEQLKNG